MWEKHKHSESTWFPYIDSLPITFTTPAYFTRTELSFLPPSVKTKAMFEHDKVTSIFTMTQIFTREKWKECSDILTYEDFRWAWYVVNSRSVHYEAGRSEYLCADEPNNMALAPYLDLLNHSPEVTVSK